MNGVIYTRVSGDEQVKGTSLEYQETACREYCNRDGIEVVAVFREEGESAKDLTLNNRRAFLNALTYCKDKRNNVGAFVVLRVDRFARNTEDHFAIRNTLARSNTKLVSATEPIGNSPSEKFVEAVLAGAAEYDNAIRRQRCVDGMSAKINQGLLPWKPPVGYQTHHSKMRGEKKTVPDAADPQTFSIIQRALKHYATGTCNQAELAGLLDAWGLRAIRNQKTYQQLVDRLLSKYLKFYAGIIHNPFTDEDVVGLHTPMITRDEMQAITLVRSGKRGSILRERFNPDFPLRRSVLCAPCKHPLTASSPRGRGGRYYYYHCYQRSCVQYGKSIPKRELEGAFQEFLKRIVPAPDFMAAFKSTVLATWAEHRKTRSFQLGRYRSELKVLATRREAIFEMREDGSYTREEFLQRKVRVEQEITEKRLLANDRKSDEFHLEEALNVAQEFLSDMGRQWFELTAGVRLRFQKLLFPGGISYCKEAGFGTGHLGCIFSLSERWDGSDEQMVSLVCDSWNQIWNEIYEINSLK